MTSPDNKDLSAYQEGLGERVGDWEMLVDLQGIADNLLAKPIAWLMHIIHGTDVEDYDTIAEISTAVHDWLETLPIIGDIVRAVTGIFGGLNDLKGFFDDLVGKALQGLNPFSIFSRIGDVFFHQAAVSNTASSAASTAGQAASTAIVATNQVTYVTEVINVRSGRSLADSGPDPTGDPSFSFSDISQNDNVTLNATTSWMGIVRIGGASRKKVVTWMAYKTGTVTGFFMDVYRMSADGTFTLIQTGPDQSGILGTTLFLNQTTLTTDVQVDLGDVIMVQFRMIGSGTVVMPSRTTRGYGFLANFVPRSTSGTRNPSSVAAPAVLTPADMAGIYQFFTPWFSLGIDLGAKPIARYFTDNYNRADLNGYNLFMPFRAAGNAPQIESNAFSYNRNTSTSGYGGGTYPQPLISDKWFCEVRLPGQNGNPHGFFVGTSDGTGFAITWNTALGMQLWSVTPNYAGNWETGYFVERQRFADIKGAGLWRTEFDAATRVLKVFLNNGPTPGKTITDTSLWVPTGPGNRNFGPVVSRFSFQTSFNVDDLTFGDIAAA